MRETIRIYVPRQFLRKWTYRVLRNKEKYKDVEKAILSARLPLTTQELFAIANFIHLYLLL